MPHSKPGIGGASGRRLRWARPVGFAHECPRGAPFGLFGCKQTVGRTCGDVPPAAVATMERWWRLDQPKPLP